MRKYNKLAFFGAILLLCVFALFSGISRANVTDTSNPHNLSASGGGAFYFGTDQVCVFCHTPHGSNTGFTTYTMYNGNTDAYEERQAGGSNMLLWNRALTSMGGKNFIPYTSSTMDSNANQIRVYSLLCLSCHDGIGAMNVLQNYPSDATITPLPDAGADQIGDVWPMGSDPGPNIGELTGDAYGGTPNTTDLKLNNDHPISIDYRASHADVTGGGLDNPATLPPAIRLFPNPTTGDLTSLECSTCHDPHVNDGDFTATDNFLAMSNDNSALCLACHNK